MPKSHELKLVSMTVDEKKLREEFENGVNRIVRAGAAALFAKAEQEFGKLQRAAAIAKTFLREGK